MSARKPPFRAEICANSWRILSVIRHEPAATEAPDGLRDSEGQEISPDVLFPGTVARVIIAEIGVDMTRFPSAGHLVSWAGLCPRLDESAGKRRSTRIRHATPWLKTALVQAAWAATRKNGSYLQSQFRRLRAGAKITSVFRYMGSMV